jgi:Zn-dependent membrane protease YugP
MLWLILGVAILLAVFGPMLWVRWVMSAYADDIEGMPGTGGELARHLIDRFELSGVTVETTQSGDHYDPAARKVRLSESNFNGRSLTAVAVAAHEVGHAMQHHAGDRNLARRTALVPLADRIARASAVMIWVAPVAGLLTRHPVPFSVLVMIGLSGLVARMLVHLVTLPTEWDASFGKALPVLIQGQYVAPGEDRVVRRVLRAAAMTYVAAALADVLNIARWVALLLRR